MARLSSSSTESEYVPAMVPFHWEAAPGRPAFPEIIDVPSLPLPPGKRPKDGFYLPFSRPAQFPHLHNEAGGMTSSSRERRPFHLKFPGSSKKPFLTSQKPRTIREEVGRVENTRADGIFSPVSGHRFGSRITRRVLVELQKRRFCLGGCLSHGRKSSSSHKHHHTDRRLDSINDSNGEIREPYPTPAQSAASGSPLSSSSSHGHSRPRNSSVAGARKQSQVLGSSRFMASMLMSFCLAETDESDEAEAVNEITDDCGDEISFSGLSTMPRARVSRPEATFQAPPKEIVVDPVSPTVSSHEDRTSAWVDKSTHMSRCMSESLHEESAIAKQQCEYCGSRKLLQPSISPSIDDYTKNSDQSFSFLDHKGNVSDAHSVSSNEASPNREERLRPTRESCKSSFSWKPRKPIRVKQDPLVAFVEANAQEPVRRSSCRDSAYSFITSSGIDTPKVNAARRSTSCNATPTAEPSLLQRNYLLEQPEPNQPLGSRPISSVPRTLLRSQAQIAAPKEFRIKDNLEVRGTSTVWLEALKSSSLWPNPAPKKSTHAATNGDSDDESGNCSDISSTESPEHETYTTVPQTPSQASPVLFNSKPPPKPATWEISEKLLKSSSLLKYKQQRQQSHESPRSSFMEDQESTTLPSPNHDSKGADILVVVPAGSPSESSKSNYGVMSKSARWESKGGVQSSDKSLPIYLSRRRGITVTGKAVSRQPL